MQSGQDGRHGGWEREDSDFLGALLDVFQTLDVSSQFESLLRHVTRWMGARAGVAFLADPEQGLLVPVASHIPPDRPWDLLSVRLDLPGARRWAEAGPPGRDVREIVSGASADAGETWPEDCRGYAVRGAPDGLAGILLLVAPSAAAGETERAVRLIDRSGVAIGHGFHVRAMGELVIKDDTVECYNRRYFEDFLNEELARASRFRAPLSLIFFDMDGLKQVNSLLGHAMGSRTLYEVSVRVRGKIRKFDKLFRFGGDEFCIVLPETEWHGALEVAERVREAIAGRLFLGDILGDGRGVKMTASFGVASFPLHARTKGDLLERADRAMQRVKTEIKNSIGVSEIHEESREP